MWLFELASSLARLEAACGSHALADSEPLITTASAMLLRNLRRWPAQAPEQKTDQKTNILLGPLMVCPRSYPFPRLPRISLQSSKPTLVSALFSSLR
jgi:hypothetical protein